MEELLEILAIYSTFGSIMSLVGIVLYVLQAFGLYTLAQRRGIQHAWLAWIPVGSMWILGSIADDYQRRARGLEKSRRKLLMILTAVMLVIAILVCGSMFGALFDLIDDMERLERRSPSYTTREYNNKMDDIMEDFFEAFVPMVLLSLAMSAVSIVAVVYQYICLYDLYASCDPNNKTLYLVLSIFISGLSSVFIFVCRNKDDGMRPAPQPGYYGYMPPQQPYQQWQQPQYQQPQYQQPPQWQDPGNGQ